MKEKAHPQPTVVCRCEDVTEDQIVETIQAGYHSPEELKRFLRCGMGHCQGRTCGSLVVRILARTLGVDQAAVARVRSRPPLLPVPLGDLAAIPEDGEIVVERVQDEDEAGVQEAKKGDHPGDGKERCR